MKTLDFIVQSLMFLLAILFLASGEAGVILVAFLQFFVGIWQLISAITNTVTSFQRLKNELTVYWCLVVAYFALLGGVWAIKPAEYLMIGAFFSAWLIAIYYYVIVIRNRFAERRKSFMDVIE